MKNSFAGQPASIIDERPDSGQKHSCREYGGEAGGSHPCLADDQVSPLSRESMDRQNQA